MAKEIQNKNHCNYLEGRGIQNYGSYQTKYDKYGSGSWISPAQKILKPFSLSSHISHHSLYSPSNAPESIVSHSHNVGGFGSWECVEFFIQFVWVNGFGMGEACVHVRWVPWTETKLPYANQEHVEEDCRKNELWVPDKNQEEDVH